MILMLGALLGFISVAFGAYADHGLRQGVTEDTFSVLMTAVRYNQVYAMMIVAIGMALLSAGKFANIQALRWSGVLFIIGTILFSFSIYISVSLNIPALVNVTPVGAMIIMAAWLLLLVADITMNCQKKSKTIRNKYPVSVSFLF